MESEIGLNLPDGNTSRLIDKASGLLRFVEE